MGGGGVGGRLPTTSLASHGWSSLVLPWSSLVLLPAQAGSVFLTTSLERAAEVGIPPHSCHEHDHHHHHVHRHPLQVGTTTIMASAPVLLLTVIAAVVISVVVDLLFCYSSKEGLCMNSKFKLLDFANGLNT